MNAPLGSLGGWGQVRRGGRQEGDEAIISTNLSGALGKLCLVSSQVLMAAGLLRIEGQSEACLQSSADLPATSPPSLPLARSVQPVRVRPRDPSKSEREQLRLAAHQWVSVRPPAFGGPRLNPGHPATLESPLPRINLSTGHCVLIPAAHISKRVSRDSPESCSKTATYRSPRLLHLAALVPSAGTIPI